MKWIGQHIYDLVSRFRSDVYLESISSGTIASGGNLGLDSNNKVVKQADTGITDLHGAGVDGSANQLLTDDGDGTVTSESGLTYDSETLYVGDDDDGFATVRRLRHTDDAGGALYIRGGDATGTNKAGGNLFLYGGRGTSNADGGKVAILTSVATGSSGTTLHTPTSVAEFLPDKTTQLKGNLVFEGATPDSYETTLSVTDPTQDATITIPNQTGTLLTSGDNTLDDFTLQSATTVKPHFTLKSTGNNNKPATMQFTKDKGAAGADGDNIGSTLYYGDNDAQEQILMAQVIGSVSDATDGAEECKYAIKVKNTSGITAVDALVLEGNGAYTDATIGYGTSSTTTTAGRFAVTGTSTFSNDATFSSSTTDKPHVTLTNTTDDATGPSLYLKNMRDSNGLSNNDVLGDINFDGTDNSGNAQSYAQIQAIATNVTNSDEAANLQLSVSASNGTTSTLRNVISGVGHGTNATVDVSLGHGATSTTTIAGTLTMGSTATLDNSGILQTAAQTNITSLGTLTNLQVDYINANASTLTITDSSDTGDLFSIATTTHGATTLTTTDDDATAAHFEVAADGNITLDAASDIALESGSDSTNSVSIDHRKFTVSSSTDGNANGDVVYFGGTTGMTTGRIYYYKSDGEWGLADADAASSSTGLLGVALGAASDTNGVLLRGMVTLNHDPGAIGDVLYIAPAGGLIADAGMATSTAPSGNTDIVRIIGYQVSHASDGNIWFNPDSTFVEVNA